MKYAIIQQNLTMFGSLWIHNMTKKITNKFWTNVFEAWLKVLDKLKHGPYYNPDLSPIWYNPCISRDKIFLKHWFDKGIVFVADLLDENGNFQSVENLQNTYNLTIHFFRLLIIKIYNKQTSFQRITVRSNKDNYKTLYI